MGCQYDRAETTAAQWTWMEESKNDQIVLVPREQIYIGWPDKAKDIPTPLRPYWSSRDELSVENSLVLKRGRISIPNITRNETLSEIYASYQGIDKSILRDKIYILVRNKWGYRKMSKDALHVKNIKLNERRKLWCHTKFLPYYRK